VSIMKRYIVAGNWKMNKDIPESVAFIEDLLAKLPNLKQTLVIICPPFTSLITASEKLNSTDVGLGAQNMHFQSAGAFTGEISAAMLKSANCTYVILGHSERRHVFNESDELIHQKLNTALASELTPILCIGETLAERQAGNTLEVLRKQYSAAFKDMPVDQFQNCIIAYEPVWAIGTGVNATPQQASEAHREVRCLIADQYDQELARTIKILYGGSVKPGNARELIEAGDIDGFLVGGASLIAEQFVAIIRSVEEYAERQEN
jgi:triosephosphate isomerase